MTPDRLRTCLDYMHWSQREFARIIERDDRQVRRWAAGQSTVPPDIAAWLERRVVDLLSDPPPLSARVRAIG